MLSWIPCVTQAGPLTREYFALRPPRHLRDFQRSWFLELVLASFDQKDMQGYLPLTVDLWRLAGAHDKVFWDKHSPCVMACFKRATVAGREVIYYPPLIEIINSQLEKLRKKERRTPRESFSESSTATNRIDRDIGERSLSQSAFVFDFESQNQKQLPNQNPTCLRARLVAELAEKLLGILAMPSTPAKLKTVESAIIAETAFLGCSLEEAARLISQRAIEDRKAGSTLDRWYFEDCKWRNNGNAGRPDKSQQYRNRVDREREVLRELQRRGGNV